MADYLEAFADLDNPGSLQPCYNCGRKFNPDTLERHAIICNKLKKRKPFDSSKQRLDGVVPSEVQIKKSPDPVKPKKNNWKQKHEDFLNTIRSARGVTAAIKKGEPLPPPPPSTVNPDYVQCPHCSRRFNEHSAERHIQFCKEQKSRIGKTPSSAAKSRVAARTQYKPPPPGKRNSTGVTSASKTRQPLSTKPTNGTTEYKASKYDNYQPPLSKNQANKPQSADTPNRPDRQRNGASSAGTTKTPKNNANIAKAQYSNRYKTKDNYMEILDKNNDEKPLNVTREVKHGRRASKPRDGSLEDLPTAVDRVGLYEKPHQTRRNITIRDPSPTLFDDYEQSIGTKSRTKNKASPFPSKAQVHRPIDRIDNTDGTKRLSKFCYECGTKYPVEHAKFCCECGTKRPFID